MNKKFKLSIYQNNFNEIDVDSVLSSQIDNKKSITGVQKKISYQFKSNKKVTIRSVTSEYIIKPNTKEYPCIAEAEYLNMQLAILVGIPTPSFGLISLHDGVKAYLIKRMDREGTRKIHMEDFSQLSNRGEEYKYNSSYEQCLKIIEKYCSNSLLDKTEFIYRLLFCYLTLNSDMHLKNFSLIEDNRIYLSPAYDLLPVNLIYPNDKEETALTLNGKKKNITYNDFLSLGKYINNGSKVIPKLIKRLSSNKEQIINCINQSLLPTKLKEQYIKEFNSRLNRLVKH